MNGYPHDIPEKAIEKLPTFQGNNAVTAKKHIKSCQLCIGKWCMGNEHNHTDVKMRLHWNRMRLIGSLDKMITSSTHLMI